MSCAAQRDGAIANRCRNGEAHAAAIGQADGRNVEALRQP